MPIKPLSVNSKFTINRYRRKIVKSGAAVKYEKTINRFLEQYAEKMAAFKANYKRAMYGLQLEIVMYVPEGEFFTKEGLISATCIDAGNALKMIEDTVYKAIGINDGYNVRVISEKRPYTEEGWLTLVAITEVPIPKVCYLDESVLALARG